MKLDAYIDKHTTVADFAAAVGVSVQTVYDWKNGDKFPSKKRYPRIKEVTKGKVTANDFV